MSVELMLDCSVCGQPRLFECPPCTDGHGDDCPELVCVECGWALIAPSVVAASSVEATTRPRAA